MCCSAHLSSASLLCIQVEEKIKQTHRKYLLQEQLKIIKKVEQTVAAAEAQVESRHTVRFSSTAPHRQIWT